MSQRKYHIAYIVIFCVLIYLPLVCFNRDPEAISFLENKKLSSMPELIVDGKLNCNFISDFETYVDDNIGFKQNAIEYNLAFMYGIFKKLDISNYIKGQDGNIFYTNNGYGIKVWQGEIRYPEEQKKDFINVLSQMKEKIRENNGNLILMGIPDKENIYPELYPASIKRVNSNTQLDDLLADVRNETDICVLPMKEKLLEKRNELGTENAEDYLYYKTYDSTHWNNKGAWIGYNTLMDALENLGIENRVKEQDVTLSGQKVETLEFLQKSELLKKTINLPDVRYDYSFNGNENIIRVEDVPENFVLNGGDIYFHYQNNVINNEKDILIIGDSYIYASLMLPLLANSFEDVYFIQSSAEQDLALYKSLKPDILVYEFVERAFYFDVAEKMMQLFTEI